MPKIKFIESEVAVSSVVAAVLFLGLMVSIITVINVSYVPEWKAGAEQSHMDEVFYDMSGMKSDLDILSAMVNSDSENGVSLSSPIRMGGGNIAIVSPGKSSGGLSINSADLSMSTTATDTSLTYHSGDFLEDMGTIDYYSDNSYFVDQIYRYEGGALLLVQDELSLMKLSPSIDIRRTENNSNITLDVHAIQLMGSGRSISSSSVEELHARYNYSDTLYSGEQLFTEMTLVVATDHPSAWEEFFRREVTDAGLFQSEYSLSSNATAVTLQLEGQAGQDIKANIRKTVFDVSLNVFGN